MEAMSSMTKLKSIQCICLFFLEFWIQSHIDFVGLYIAAIAISVALVISLTLDCLVTDP